MFIRKTYTCPKSIVVDVVTEGAVFIGSGGTTEANGYEYGGTALSTESTRTLESVSSSRSFDLTPSNDGDSLFD